MTKILCLFLFHRILLSVGLLQSERNGNINQGDPYKVRKIRIDCIKLSLLSKGQLPRTVTRYEVSTVRPSVQIDAMYDLANFSPSRVENNTHCEVTSVSKFAAIS